MHPEIFNCGPDQKIAYDRQLNSLVLVNRNAPLPADRTTNLTEIRERLQEYGTTTDVRDLKQKIIYNINVKEVDKACQRYNARVMQSCFLRLVDIIVRVFTCFQKSLCYQGLGVSVDFHEYNNHPLGNFPLAETVNLLNYVQQNREAVIDVKALAAIGLPHWNNLTLEQRTFLLEMLETIHEYEFPTTHLNEAKVAAFYLDLLQNDRYRHTAPQVYNKLFVLLQKDPSYFSFDETQNLEKIILAEYGNPNHSNQLLNSHVAFYTVPKIDGLSDPEKRQLVHIFSGSPNWTRNSDRYFRNLSEDKKKKLIDIYLYVLKLPNNHDYSLFMLNMKGNMETLSSVTNYEDKLKEIALL